MEKIDLIEDFFDRKLITATRTRDVYRNHIKGYFKIINKDINTYIPTNGRWKNLSDSEKEDYIEQFNADLRKVYLLQEKNKKPLLSRRTYFNSVKQFMITQNKELKELEFWETLKHRVKGAEPAGDNYVPNQKDIKGIISHGNTLSRAFFLIMASSGRRVDEILALFPEDIDTSKNPTEVNITKGYDHKSPNKIKPTTKSKSKTLCFISDEAKDAYLAWLKERDTYLKNACKKSYTYKKNPNDKRVFPISDANIRFIWRNMVARAGFIEKDENGKVKTDNRGRVLSKKDSKTNYTFFHPHCLRKFFRSYLGNADIAEFLMGHGTALTVTYRNMKKEDLAKKFLELMPNVTIFETIPDLSGVHEQLKEVTYENKELQKQLNDLRMEMLEIKMKQVQELQKKKE